MSSDRTPLIGGEKEKPKSNFAASCSNFSIQYNLAVASVRCAVVRTLLLHETETHDFIYIYSGHNELSKFTRAPPPLVCFVVFGLGPSGCNPNDVEDLCSWTDDQPYQPYR